MKKKALLMAGILALHTLGASLATAGGDDLSVRQQELMRVLEEKGAKQAIREMTDDELRSVRDDLRGIISTLSEDFAIATLQDGERFGYKVRTVGLYGMGAAAGIFMLGVLDDAFGYGARMAAADRGGSTMAGFVLGAMIGTVSVLTATSGQMVVWLTPSEAAQVQSKLQVMVKALNQLENRLK